MATNTNFNSNNYYKFSELIPDLIEIFSKEFYLPIKIIKKNDENIEDTYKKKLVKLLNLYEKKIASSNIFKKLYGNVENIVYRFKQVINENNEGDARIEFEQLLDFIESMIDNSECGIFKKENVTLIPGYRVRKEEHKKRKDLFHKPYNDKLNYENKFTGRFSSKEALFFSDDVKTTIIETNLLDGNKINGKLSIAKLKYEQNPYAHVSYYDFGLNPKIFSEYPAKIAEYHSTSQAFYEWYILWFPIMMSCLFVNIDGSDIFYKYSNWFYDWAIKKYNIDGEIMMIRYISCKPNNKNLFANNYVIYTKPSDKDEEYSKLIRECYKLTIPECYDKDTLVQKIEVELTLKDEESLDYVNVNE